MLNELAETCLANSKRWFPAMHTATWDQVTHMTLGLAGEAGEVANLVKKVNRGSDHLSRMRPDLALELADVLTYTLNLAACLNIDLEEALATKQAICEQRWGKR